MKRARLLPPDRVRVVSGPVELHSALRSSETSPNLRMNLASPKSPVAGSPVRKATAPTERSGFRRAGGGKRTLSLDPNRIIGVGRRSPTIITETLEDDTRVRIRIEGELEMKIAVEGRPSDDRGKSD